METIKNYLDNMFMGLPKTAETDRLKEELLSSMEDKYNELKAQGKSENEAIGIVISEFGNIEELAAELNIDMKEKSDSPEITQEVVDQFMKIKKKSAWLISIGVLLCILGANCLVFVGSTAEYSPNSPLTPIGIVAFIVFIAIAVGLFIFSGVRLESYKYLEEDFNMTTSVKNNIETEQAQYAPKRIVLLIIGIILCILSSIFVLIPSMTTENDLLLIQGVNILLLFVAVGVFLIVFSGVIQDGYNILLKKEDYAPVRKESEKIVGAIAGVYWPIMVCIYLLWSFLSGNWQFTWIMWPVAGVLFGAVASIIEVTHKNK